MIDRNRRIFKIHTYSFIETNNNFSSSLTNLSPAKVQVLAMSLELNSTVTTGVIALSS